MLLRRKKRGCLKCGLLKAVRKASRKLIYVYASDEDASIMMSSVNCVNFFYKGSPWSLERPYGIKSVEKCYSIEGARKELDYARCRAIKQFIEKIRRRIKIARMEGDIKKLNNTVQH